MSVSLTQRFIFWDCAKAKINIGKYCVPTINCALKKLNPSFKLGFS